MRSSLVLPLILLCSLEAAQRVTGKAQKKAGKKEGPEFPLSGQFSTQEHHTCNWEITGEQSVRFAVSCNQPQNQSYECTYEGQPQLCPTYDTKAKQYWKQIFSKMKKKKNACEERVLKSRLCKKGSPAESQLRLVQKTPVSMEERGKSPKKGKGARGEVDNAQDPKPGAFPTNPTAKPEKKAKAKQTPLDKADGSSKPSDMPIAFASDEQSPVVREGPEEMTEFSDDLSAEYCAENWHSLCSFFVNFWNG